MISLNPKHMGVDIISALPIQDLCILKNEVDFLLKEAKEQSDILEEALAKRFSNKTQEMLLETGRDSGTVNFEEQDYLISAQLPKKVTWDQDKLAELIIKIDPLERKKYVETSYKINEQRYLANFPISLRELLDEAREVSTGKLKISLKLRD